MENYWVVINMGRRTIFQLVEENYNVKTGIRNLFSLFFSEKYFKDTFLCNPQTYQLIAWSQPDKNLHGYIEYILDLCWENLSTKEERKSFGSKDWIRNKIVSVC